MAKHRKSVRLISMLVLVQLFDCVYRIRSEQCYTKGEGLQCYTEKLDSMLLSICPWPIIVHPDQNVTLKIGCCSLDDDFQCLYIGVDDPLASGFINYIVQKPKKGNYGFIYSRNPVYKPDGTLSMNQDRTKIRLTLKSASLRDLEYTYACEIRPIKVETHYPRELVLAIPYPINTTLTAKTAQESYDSQDIVALVCKAIVAMNFPNTKGRTLTHVFQYWNPKKMWVEINEHDTAQVEKITSGKLTEEGRYKSQTRTLRLRVSSIPECSRRYRCVLSYTKPNQNVAELFDDKNMPQVTINVTPCTGRCKLDSQSCKTLETTTQYQENPKTKENGLTTIHKEDETVTNSTTRSTKAYSTQGLLIGISIPVGLGLLVLVVFINHFVQQRNQTSAAAQEIRMDRFRSCPQPHHASRLSESVVSDDCSISLSQADSSSVAQGPDESGVSYSQPSTIYFSTA